MTRSQARKKAHALWYRRANTFSPTVGDRFGASLARTKKIAQRFEVGYIELVSLKPEQWDATTLGRGTSWEEAFDRAEASAP